MSVTVEQQLEDEVTFLANVPEPTPKVTVMIMMAMATLATPVLSQEMADDVLETAATLVAVATLTELGYEDEADALLARETEKTYQKIEEVKAQRAADDAAAFSEIYDFLDQAAAEESQEDSD